VGLVSLLYKLRRYWYCVARRLEACSGSTTLRALVTDSLPLRGELICQMAMFVSKCVYSKSSIVNFVSRHGVYFSVVNSPIELNTQLCCSRFDLLLYRLTSINRNLVQRRVPLQSAVHCSAVGVIRDMLCVKSRQMMIPGFERMDIDFMLSLCVF